MEPRSEPGLVWRGLKQNLLSGARLAFFLPVRGLDFRISVGQCVALVSMCLALRLAVSVARQGFPGTVDFDALAAALGEIPVLLAVCLLAGRVFRESRLAIAFAVVFLACVPVFEIADPAFDLLSGLEELEPYAYVLDWAFLAWAFAVVVRAQTLLTGWRGRASVFALGAFALAFAVLLEFPSATDPWVAAGGADADATPVRLTQEEVFHRQGKLLDERLAALKPERRGVVDLYFVGVAGDGRQDTFYSEVASIKELMDERFDTAGRSIVLVNNPATLMEHPIASVSNLRETLAHLGNELNTEEDIVLLHLATHGSSDYRLAFDLPPLELAQLTPSALARMLADSGIKWKVIVISACFSGGFIEPLKDDNTLIITAADAFHSSFGCDYDSDYTWFSQALYDDALRETFSFVEAFDAAKDAVGDRERAEGYEPSNPQIFIGGAMRKKLAALERRLAAGSAKAPHRTRASKVRASESRIVLVKGR